MPDSITVGRDFIQTIRGMSGGLVLGIVGLFVLGFVLIVYLMLSGLGGDKSPDPIVVEIRQLDSAGSVDKQPEAEKQVQVVRATSTSIPASTAVVVNQPVATSLPAATSVPKPDPTAGVEKSGDPIPTTAASDNNTLEKVTNGGTYPTGYVEVADLTPWITRKDLGGGIGTDFLLKTHHATGGYVVAVFKKHNAPENIIKRFSTDGEMLETVMPRYSIGLSTCAYSENIYYCSDGSVISASGTLLEKHDIGGIPYVSPLGKVLYLENERFQKGCPTGGDWKGRILESAFDIYCDAGADTVYFSGEKTSSNQYDSDGQPLPIEEEYVHYLKIQSEEVQIESKSLLLPPVSPILVHAGSKYESLTRGVSYGFTPDHMLELSGWPKCTTSKDACGPYSQDPRRRTGVAYNGNKLVVSIGGPSRVGHQSLFEVDLDWDKLTEYTNLGIGLNLVPSDVPIDHWSGEVSSTDGLVFGLGSNRIFKYDYKKAPEEVSEVFVDYSKACENVWAVELENAFLCHSKVNEISLVDINETVIQQVTVPGIINRVDNDLNVWWSNEDKFGVSDQNGVILHEFEDILGINSIEWGFIQSDGTIFLNTGGSSTLGMLRYAPEVGKWLKLRNPVTNQREYNLNQLREKFICDDGFVYWDGGTYRWYESILDLSLEEEFQGLTYEGAENMRIVQCVTIDTLIRESDSNENYLVYYERDPRPEAATFGRKMIQHIAIPQIQSYSGFSIGDQVIISGNRLVRLE